MTFDHYTLKKAEREGMRLGNWNGKAVFASSANHLENKGSGAYYILYDDENKIVARTNSGWESYGEVTSQGSVNEYSSARNYKTPAEAAEAARKAKEERSYSTSGMRYSSEPIPQAVMKVCGVTADAPEGSYSPGYNRTERPMGDVELKIDVEKTLKMAREMTVESLLEGFLPGVSYDVAKG
jgi:hypothetical protein